MNNYGLAPHSATPPILQATPLFSSITGTSLQVSFHDELRCDGLTDPASYLFSSQDRGAFPFTVLSVSLLYSLRATGFGSVVDGPLALYQSQTPTFSGNLQVGDYLTLTTGANVGQYRVTAVLAANVVKLDRPLMVEATPSPWSLTTGVTGAILTTTKQTDGKVYAGEVRGSLKATGHHVLWQGSWVALSEKPRVRAASNPSSNVVVVDFGEPMRFDRSLTNPTEYSIERVPPVVGKSVSVVRVAPVSDHEVALELLGLESASYRVRVNASGTPHDIAGNPMDPAFNTAVFTGNVPIEERSVYTDHGPLARPPLILQQGLNATITAPQLVTISTGTLTTDLTGRYLQLSGTGHSDGDYLILAVPAVNQLKVAASFTLPDSAALTWKVYDPRDGQIADDPSHVTVRVNGLPVEAEAVVGLLGQVILPSVPAPTDTVTVDYSWVRNPTVDASRMNSREFRFNNWNRDTGRQSDASRHKYRYNNVLVAPSSYKPQSTVQQGQGVTVLGADTVDLTSSHLLPSFVGLTLSLTSLTGTTYYRIGAVLSGTSAQVTPAALVGPYASWSVLDQDSVVLATYAQPTERDLLYRAYERAYTPIFNDPNLLIFNSPNHHIAYPPLERTVSAKFVSYTPSVLPENATDPWVRLGSGTATLVNGELSVQDGSAGSFPAGDPLCWKQQLDLSFPHAFALAWKMSISNVPTYDGVWSGVGAGYSDASKAVLVGYVRVGGVAQFGVLRKGYGDRPSDPAAWIGAFDNLGNPTYQPVTFDWTALHSYRLYRGKDGTIRVFIDGNVVETLRVSEDDLPHLEELAVPFNELQQVFWGSLSRPAANLSVWDFVRYQVLPLNPYQTAPSIFVSYEATNLPEDSPHPWTPVGYHGTETIESADYLRLDSTSATDAATEAKVGLMGGDFRGFVRAEPLLAASADVVLDVDFQGLTQTHGISPNALMAAVDDGSLLTQLAWFTDKAAPLLGYGGRSLPTDWTPTPWTVVGNATGEMVGRTLRITDASPVTGIVYYVDDVAPLASDSRVFSASNDYTLEFRAKVVSYTPDVTGFCGATADIYDGFRTLGVLFLDVAGTRYLALHSDGIVKASFAFEWNDQVPHTYRFIKNTGADLVTLYADATYVGSLAYSSFTVPAGPPTGTLSFGSSTPASMAAQSVVEWSYVNSWRVWPSVNRYVGIWRGTDPNSLTGYHLPLKVAGDNAQVTGNVLTSQVAFPPSVVAGDRLIIDDGPNKGVYEITAVLGGPYRLVVDRPFPLQPSVDSYRVPQITDWSQFHRYRLVRTPAGGIVLLLDADPNPVIELDYSNMSLPSSLVGVPWIISGGLPSITWGAFDPTVLSSSRWDYVRYGATRAPTELRLVPHHEVLNQRNVIASPEHLRSKIRHPHTDFWSSSTGIPPQTVPDFMTNPAVAAYTKLNQGTPLVPRTQTSEVRGPTPVKEFVSAFNRIDDLMNRESLFKLNDGAVRWKLLVPDDVLYNSLEVIERVTGEDDLIAPLDDRSEPLSYAVEWQKEVCLHYDGGTLPEQAANQPTPWALKADSPAHVEAFSFNGVLTFGTDLVATRAAYMNPTPLPDTPSLSTKVSFRIKVAADTTYGLGDSQVRLGFSSVNMTLALGFVSLPSGERYVVVTDLKSGTVLGGLLFDWLDGQFHTYSVLRNPGHGNLTVTVDS